jgi:hypothetical protein
MKKTYFLLKISLESEIFHSFRNQPLHHIYQNSKLKYTFNMILIKAPIALSSFLFWMINKVDWENSSKVYLDKINNIYEKFEKES